MDGMKMRDKFWKIWDMAQQAPQYRMLLLKLRKLDREYEAALMDLTDDQRMCVCGFVALCEGMSDRMLEIACEQMDFPQ